MIALFRPTYILYTYKSIKRKASNTGTGGSHGEHEQRTKTKKAVKRDKSCDKSEPPEGDISELAANVFNENIALVKSIVKRLEGLDPVVTYDDYLQQAYLGTHNAVRSFRVTTDARFQTILVWHIQKALEKLIPPQNRQVIVTFPNGDEKRMSYQAFRKIKRGLPDGTTYQIESRSVSWDLLEGYDLNGLENGTRSNGKNRRSE